ncbi:MAG: hypothetical protein CO189_04085 [candidate division Zixibacteria bacterium CG_4_9_14_3_um_filter_46_8]|nr:MAG: hypothetical protein CO189_04085 [candidate division Zixibacteria bacterium CG_4_9_14_3_um_filter_46_8]
MKAAGIAGMLILACVIEAVSSPYQIQLGAGYRPQINTSNIDYPYLSSWEGFVDVPFFGLNALKAIDGDWYGVVSYRYLHKVSGLSGGNEVTLDYHLFALGPYYRSPTTESRSFFINLSALAGITYSSFEMDIAGVSDQLSRTGIALMGTLGFEKTIYRGFSLIAELNYNLIDPKVSGGIGNSQIPLETKLMISGLDIALAAGYEFDL